MGTRGIERKLRKVSRRLVQLRTELGVADEQLAHLADEAADTALRALVADSPAAGPEHRQAQAHADAMAAHRDRIVAQIADLEVRQDQLLDALGGE